MIFTKINESNNNLTRKSNETLQGSRVCLRTRCQATPTSKSRAAADKLQLLQRLNKGQPIRSVRRQQPHTPALVHGQQHPQQVAHGENEGLQVAVAGLLEHFHSGPEAHEGLDGPEEHHAHHHNREDRYVAAGHVHDEHVHGQTFNRAEGDVPRAFVDQLAVVFVVGLFHLVADRSVLGRDEARGTRELGQLLVTS